MSEKLTLEEKFNNLQQQLIDNIKNENKKIEHILSDLEDFIEANKFKDKEDQTYWTIDVNELTVYLYKIRQKSPRDHLGCDKELTTNHIKLYRRFEGKLPQQVRDMNEILINKGLNPFYPNYPEIEWIAELDKFYKEREKETQPDDPLWECNDCKLSEPTKQDCIDCKKVHRVSYNKEKEQSILYKCTRDWNDGGFPSSCLAYTPEGCTSLTHKEDCSWKEPIDTPTEKEKSYYISYYICDFCNGYDNTMKKCKYSICSDPDKKKALEIMNKNKKQSEIKDIINKIAREELEFYEEHGYFSFWSDKLKVQRIKEATEKPKAIWKGTINEFKHLCSEYKKAKDQSGDKYACGMCLKEFETINELTKHKCFGETRK